MNNLLAEVNIGEQINLGSKTITQAPQFQSPGAFISVILPNIYTAAGICVFLLFLFGGISIIAGTNQNDPKKASQGKKAITAALIGFLIIFASYWIMGIISYMTGIGDLKQIFKVR